MALIEEYAKKNGIENYSLKYAGNLTSRLHEKTRYRAPMIERAEPKQHEIEIAEILKNHGYEIVFTPAVPDKDFNKKNPDDKVKNPEGIIRELNMIVELKEITAPSLNRLKKRLLEADEQNAEIAVLYAKGEKEYSRMEAVNLIKDKIESTSSLKQVWLIMDGMISKIIKSKK